MKPDAQTSIDRLLDAFVRDETDYVVAISRDYKILMANNLFANEFAFHPGDACYGAWKGRDRKCEGCLVEQSFKDGGVHRSRETVLDKRGCERSVIVTSTPVKNESGDILYVVETATNESDRRELTEKLRVHSEDAYNTILEKMEELRKSEEKFRTVFEHSPDAILITDHKGRISEINRSGLDALGCETRQDLVGKQSMHAFVDADERTQFLEIILRDGFVKQFEARMTGNRGLEFDAQVTSNLLTDSNGRAIGHAVIFRDISGIKEIQRRLEKQNTRLSTLNAISMTVNTSLDLKDILDRTIARIIEILESDSVRIYLLDEEREFLVLTAHQGLSREFVSAPHMKRRRLGDGLLGQTALTGETRIADNISRSGDPYVSSFIEEGLLSTIYIPLSARGKPVGVMCVSSHTVYRFPEEYIHFLAAIGNQIGVAIENANLYEHVKRSLQELRDAQEQIIRAEKLASLGKLAATIAHEINNPLAAVRTYARLLMKLSDKDAFHPERAGDILKYLNTMETETARCGEIVKNLLEFSRHSEIAMGAHTVTEILEKALALMAHTLEISGIRVEKEYRPDLPRVRCDFNQIQQVFINLLSNACESMTAGGVLTLRVFSTDPPEYVEVVVEDTGHGISETELKHIFEPFFTTKEQGKGVGLGLSVVYGIIARHNGVIEVKSEPGCGAAFHVRLPVAEAEAAS